MSLSIVRSLTLIPCSLFFSCGFGEDVDGAIDELEDNFGNLEICDGMTFRELSEADAVSDECKLGIKDFLPDARNNYINRVVVLGTKTEADGAYTIYLHGVDAEGRPIDAEAFREVSVIAWGQMDGILVPDEEMSVTVAGELSGDLISLSFVNDYSASMNDADLEVVADIESDILSLLPSVYETEVIQFSTEVTVKQPFTSDQDVLQDAVKLDTEYEQQSTALYDGMGEALKNLVPRSRPVQLLVVSTDGAENRSVTYDKRGIVNTVNYEGIVVVMLGAFFANIDEMSDLMGQNGIYFYTPYYDDLTSAVRAYIDSLGEMAAITISPDWAPWGPFEIISGDVTVVAE